MKLPVAVLLGCAACLAQSPSPAPAAAVTSRNDSRNDELVKGVDNLTWRLALGEVADVDNITYTSLPPRYNPNPTAQGTGNPLIIHALTFIPKNLDRTKKHPLILLAHGGVHRNFGTMYIHIVRNSWGKGTASSPPAIAVAPGIAAIFTTRSTTAAARSTMYSRDGSGCSRTTAFPIRHAWESWAGATAG